MKANKGIWPIFVFSDKIKERKYLKKNWVRSELKNLTPKQRKRKVLIGTNCR